MTVKSDPDHHQLGPDNARILRIDLQVAVTMILRKGTIHLEAKKFIGDANDLTLRTMKLRVNNINVQAPSGKTEEAVHLQRAPLSVGWL